MKLRVLIVEDDPFIAMDLEGVLSEAGCDVCGVATSEAEALRMQLTELLRDEVDRAFVEQEALFATA